MNSNNVKNNDYPLYLYHEGKNSESYRFFGAHKVEDTNDTC